MTSVDQAVPAPEATERSAHANARGNLRRFAAPAIVFVAAAAAFGYSAFMDPDPHHDGIQMAPAVAVSEGLFIHRDVFDQYGPITAWLQGAAVFVFGPHLLTIRMLTALLLSICAVLMFLVARSVMRSTSIAMLLSVLWIVLWPGRSVESLTYLFLPWPSITFLLLQLLAALFVIRILRQPPATDAWFAALGVVTGVAVLTRLNYGAPMAVCIVIALFLFQSNVRTISGRQWASLAIGLAAPVAAVAGLLVLNGALGAFLVQTIAGPLTGAATGGTSTPWFFV
ncbi:MAG: hypothetical protein F2836_04980, partial [Actinobacteria bacterium]|nr:hypothetical protein [Actinomycetota bacterium]